MTDFPFLNFRQVNAMVGLKCSHNRFLAHTFQFTITNIPVIQGYTLSLK